MALHVLTFQDLQDEASHAISGTPDGRTSLARLVNGAVEYLCNLFPWSWRTSITTLATVADQAYVELPADFGRLIDLQTLELRGAGLSRANPRAVMAARAHGFPGLAGFVWCLGQSPQTDPASPPLRRLELGPKPAVSTSDAFSLVYRSHVPAMVNPTDVPAIPYGMFELLRVLVRAVTVSSTTQQAGHDWELFNAMIRDYTSADGLADGENAGMLGSMLDDFDFGGETNLRPGVSILMAGDA